MTQPNYRRNNMKKILAGLKNVRPNTTSLNNAKRRLVSELKKLTWFGYGNNRENSHRVHMVVVEAGFRPSLKKNSRPIVILSAHPKHGFLKPKNSPRSVLNAYW